MGDSFSLTLAYPDAGEGAGEGAGPEQERRPAELLATPIVVLSLLALLANDHWLKAAHPSWLTGKISDVVGLIVAPVMLVSLVEVVAWSRGRTLADSSRRMSAIVGVVGIVFAAVQLVPAATEIYAELAGHTARFVATIVPFLPSGGGPADVTADPTDLVALIALIVPIRLSRR